MVQEIQLYQTDNNIIKLDVRIDADTVWLTQKQMALLYGTEVPAISKHIKNIYASNELEEVSTVSKMEIVQNEGGRSISRLMMVYNLDVIIAVGYRVNSKKATAFRIWATNVLNQLAKRAEGVSATICMNHITESFRQDVQRYNRQYSPVNVRLVKDVHDRFMLIDNEKLYTFGASFKDLGRKLFCFSLMEDPSIVEAVRKISSPNPKP